MALESPSMAVPDFQTFLLPLLRLTADGKEHSLRDLRKPIQAALALSEDDLTESLPSGMQSKFSNRLAWASVYLIKAGVLKRVRRGVFQITDRGRELLGENPEKATVKMLSRYPEFIQFYKGSDQSAAHIAQIEWERTETPEERLASDYQILREGFPSVVES